MVALKHHIPSVLNMDGNRVLITYDGQPLRCYGCGEIGHQYQACPHRRRPRQLTVPTPTTSWAALTSGKMATTPHGDGEIAPPPTTETCLPNSPATSPIQPPLVDGIQTHIEDLATPHNTENTDNGEEKQETTYDDLPNEEMAVDLDIPPGADAGDRNGPGDQ
jgi:hypothetical protein